MEILWLGETACHNVSIVGGKAAHLSRLASRNHVPRGFCISASLNEIRHLIKEMQENQRDQVKSAELRRKVRFAYEKLSGTNHLKGVGVAVRSSSTEEDTKEASFAGQFETYLNVKGLESVLDAIVRCFGSFLTVRALGYKKHKGLTLKGSRLAVLVQEQVLADVSVVVFSANPATQDRGEVVINASWGLGESLVSGRVTPDSYTVRKGDGRIISSQVSEKLVMTVLAPVGSRQVDVPRIMQTEPCLNDNQVGEISKLAVTLEETQGWPVDIECAIQNDKVYLLQCRPITTLDTQGGNG